MMTIFMYACMGVILSCGHKYVIMCLNITETWETGSLHYYFTLIYFICVSSRVQMIPGLPGPLQ